MLNICSRLENVMAKENEFITLKKQIKEKKPSNLYLFFGDEIYVKNVYVKKIKELIDDGGFPEFNHILIDDRSAGFDAIDDAIESFPMMAEQKLIIIKNSGIFAKANEETKEYWTNRLNKLPEHVTLLFDETDVDKRSSLYKVISKSGLAVEFEYLSETDMVLWIEREVKQYSKTITRNNAQFMAGICDKGLSYVKHELDKLISFCDKEITQSDIDRLVAKSLDIRVFELTDAIMTRDANTAVTLINDLKTVKESAFKILYLISGTFDKMLRSKLMLSQGGTINEIAEKTGLRPFIVKKYIEKGRNFNENYLINRIMRVADIDLSIKEGSINEWTALEQYIIESIENF